MPSTSPYTRWQIHNETTPLEELVGLSLDPASSSQDEQAIDLYDSYDQSLRQAGLCLQHIEGEFVLASADDLTSNSVSIKSTRKSKNHFWHDFPEGKLRDTLEKYLKLRAASHIATIDLSASEYPVRNEDGKIVVRILRESITIRGKDKSVSFIELRPLLGYEEEGDQLASKLDAGEGVTRELSPVLDWVMQGTGKSEVPLSPAKAIKLTPEQSSQEAVTEIARFMIAAARQTETGIIQDIDTEFLHDYRVSIRKLRSVLSLIKGVFPKLETKRLKSVFGGFARTTNRLRDLDVYLMEEEHFKSMLPPSLRPGLEPMFEDFRSERKRELQRVRRHLKSKAYLESIKEQSDWFHQEKLPSAERSELPISKISSHEIYLHYKRVTKRGSSLQDDTPDDEVHELRIECKKLRYLLELFSSLYPAKEIKVITKQLKGLQNTLGNFNDYTVQQTSLADYLGSAHSLDRNTAAAIGGLIAHLRQAQLDARKNVSDKFIQFNDDSMKRRFKNLFSENSK